MILTKKAARASGYLSERDLERKPLAPKHGAEPTIIKGERFYTSEQCDELISQTEAARRKLIVPATANPVKTLAFNPGKRVEYRVYRVSDCISSDLLTPAGRKRQNMERVSRLDRQEAKQASIRAEAVYKGAKTEFDGLVVQYVNSIGSERRNLRRQLRDLKRRHGFELPEEIVLRNFQTTLARYPSEHKCVVLNLVKAFGGEQADDGARRFFFPTQEDMTKAREVFSAWKSANYVKH
jgi:hypothetical protein